MSIRFEINQLAYIAVSNRYIQPVTILRIDGKKYLVRLERSGEMWVDEGRLYATKEEAEKSLEKSKFTLKDPDLLSYIDKWKRYHERPEI